MCGVHYVHSYWILINGLWYLLYILYQSELTVQNSSTIWYLEYCEVKPLKICTLDTIMQSLLLCCLRHRTNETILKEVFHLVNILISHGIDSYSVLYQAFSDSVLRFLSSVLHASIPPSCFQSLCAIIHHCLLRSSVYLNWSHYS